VPYRELQMTLDDIAFQYVLLLSLLSRTLLLGAGLGQSPTDAKTSLHDLALTDKIYVAPFTLEEYPLEFKAS
jgi:hypothetical protein